MYNIFTAYHCSFQHVSVEGTVLEGSGAEWRSWWTSMPITFVAKNHCKPPASGKIAHQVMGAEPGPFPLGLCLLICDSAWMRSPLVLFPLKTRGSEQPRMSAWVITSVMSNSCVTPWTEAHQAPLSMDSPGKNTGVGCHFLLHHMCIKRMKGKLDSFHLLLTPASTSHFFIKCELGTSLVVQWLTIYLAMWEK